MSEHKESPEGEVQTRAEEDVINTRKLVAVGIGALVIFVGGSLLSTWVLSSRRAALLPQGPPAIPAAAGQAKIGLVEQQLFENQRRAQRMRAEQLQRLQEYGWVNREGQVIHEPIGEAMRRVASGERP